MIVLSKFMQVRVAPGTRLGADALRMYSRWCDTRGFKIEIIEESAGEEAGIKSVTRVNGDTAYGWMKTESGVHRLLNFAL